MLQSYGSSSHFAPYLDEHQLKARKLKEQLFANIDASNVFLPLITHDYVVEDTVSKEEFEKAFKMVELGKLKIIPVFINSPNTEASRRIRECDYFY